MFKQAIVVIVTLAAFYGSAYASQVIYVYGPGGPAPAIKAAATAYESAHGIKVSVTAGPTGAWSDDFKKNGDLIYSGSEAMMSDFVTQFKSSIVDSSIEPLYLRPAAILVRPGNPKNIRGFRDLLKPDIQVMVVHGAGQVGLWEDIAGRDGNIATIQSLRHNIVFFAPNSAQAKGRWQQDKTIDAWIIYNIWSIANPGIAEIVPLEPRYRIYRDCDVAYSIKGQNEPATQAFVAFLKSSEGRSIFAKYGWSDHASTN